MLKKEAGLYLLKISANETPPDPPATDPSDATETVQGLRGAMCAR